MRDSALLSQKLGFSQKQVRMYKHDSSEALITILRSTLLLLEHYDYNGHDPSLSELQRSIRNAIREVQAAPPVDGSSANGFDRLDRL